MPTLLIGRRTHQAALILAGTSAAAFAQWLLVWLFARYAGGPVAVGDYATLLAVTTPAFILAQFGLRTVYLTLRREVSWLVYVQLRIAGVVLASAILVLLFASLDLLQVSAALIASMLFVKSADSFVELYSGRLQRFEMFTVLGSLMIANAVLTAALAALVVLKTGSMAGALLASGCVSFAVAAVSASAKSVSRQDCDAGPGAVHLVLRAGLPVTMSQGAAVLANYLPTLLLSAWAFPAAVGIYAAMAYLLTAANLVGATLQTLLLTSFRATYERCGPENAYRRASSLARRLVISGVLLIPLVVLLGQEVTSRIYGPAFQTSKPQLALLAVAAAAIAPSYLFSVALVVLNAYALELRIWTLAILVGLFVGALSNAFDVSPSVMGVLIAASVAWARLLGVLLAARYRCLGTRSGSWQLEEDQRGAA